MSTYRECSTLQPDAYKLDMPLLGGRVVLFAAGIEAMEFTVRALQSPLLEVRLVFRLDMRNRIMSNRQTISGTMTDDWRTN